MLRIRLTRGGSKKRPYYAIVVADSHSPRDGRFIERVGTYNPLLKKDDPNRVTLKTESLQAWLKKGAQPSDRVARFLAAEGLVQWTHGDNPNKGKPHAKAVERVAQREERAAALAAAPPPPPPPPPVEEPEATEAVAEETVPAEEAPLQADQAEDAAPAEEPAVTETPAEEPAPVEAPAETTPEEAPAEAAPEEAPAEAAPEEAPAADDGATEA